ncbi:MAG: YaiI/YqxD family protein [Pseudorhodoplanes sp.]|uniref:YaiI/YqxD family protein n=1 Tax=Pseudorhodoplanes sp. TaxID=1934341 RepID=UPI003D0D9474
MAPDGGEAGARGPIVILVDADACPVKAEIYKVAERHGLRVFVVANAPIAIPRDALIERVVVPGGMDKADDWIAERAGPGTIVVTADIPLASRGIKAGAVVIAPDGRTFTDDSIGMTLATRNLMDELRSAGASTRGPAPFSRQARSAFVSALDLAVVRLKRAGFAAT